MKLIKQAPWRMIQRLLFCSVVFFGAPVAAADDPPDVQEVAVTITVQKPDGTPLEQAPIALLTKAQGRFAFTNANGVASFTIAKVGDEEHIMAFMSSGMWFTPPDDRSTAIDRYHELRKIYAFKRQYYVPTVGDGPYSLTIQAAEAVTLTARLVNAGGAPMLGWIGSEDTVSHEFASPENDGEFSLGGVTKGQDAVLWYSAGDTSQVHRLVLGGMLLQGDINLGSIVVNNTPLNAIVSVTNSNYEQMFLKDKVDLAQDMTLIERSSLDMFVFYVARGTGEVRQHVPEDVPPADLRITAGEYFVVPGNLLDLPSRATYAALLAGKAQDLEDAGVPLINLQPGQNPHVTIDAKAAVEAIMQVGGDLVQD